MREWNLQKIKSGLVLSASSFLSSCSSKWHRCGAKSITMANGSYGRCSIGIHHRVFSFCKETCHLCNVEHMEGLVRRFSPLARLRNQVTVAFWHPSTTRKFSSIVWFTRRFTVTFWFPPETLLSPEKATYVGGETSYFSIVYQVHDAVNSWKPS